MIIYIEKGNIFESTCDALVNPVNTEGIMGKGLALKFKVYFPMMFREYYDACLSRILVAGDILTYKYSETKLPKYILNFATKYKWKDLSKYEYIISGLKVLKEIILKKKISVAIPAIGCGLGGLKWSVVKELININLHGIPYKIEVYSPH